MIAISFSPLAVKMVSFTTSVSAFYRSFYAALFFFIFALFNYRSQISVKDKKWIVPSILAGLFLGADLEIWHKTIVYLGAGPATFLGNSQIIFVTLFAALVFRERIPKVFYAVLAAVMLGLFLLIPMKTTGVSRPIGYLLGLIVGFTYAGMLICLRYAKTLSGKEYPEIMSLAVVFIVSAAVILVYTVFAEHDTIFVQDPRSHIIMIMAAFFCQTYGWFMINSNIVRIPAHEGSLLLMLQPLLATVWGSVFFYEPLGMVQFIGIFLTLAGIIFYQMRYAVKTDEARV